jgi:hypothetical protein
MAKDYESDVTRFLRDMRQRRPELERRQREAREIWWDKALDPDEQARFKQSRVQQPGYVYQTKPKQLAS